MSNATGRALENEHLLRSDWRSGGRWFELAHDRLISAIKRINRPAASSVAAVSPIEYLRAAESALAEGELELAAKHAHEALRISAGVDLRTDAETSSFLADVAMQQHQFDEAEHWYRRAAELFEVLQDRTAVGRL